jgi:hypothetical protein
VELFDSIPNGVIVFGDVPLWFIYMTYASLLLVTFGWSNIQNWFKSSAASLRAAALTLALTVSFICMFVFWSAAGKSGDGRFHLIFLEAGSADAVLIQHPHQRRGERF